MPVETPRDWQDQSETDGSFAIACAIMYLVRAVDRLGNADASTPMGAIEAFGEHIGNKLESLTQAMGEIADAITHIGEGD